MICAGIMSCRTNVKLCMNRQGIPLPVLVSPPRILQAIFVIVKLLISRGLFQKVAVKVACFLGVCCNEIAGASEVAIKSCEFPSF